MSHPGPDIGPTSIGRIDGRRRRRTDTLRILIAGGSGVLGQRTAERLTGEGHDVARLGLGAGNDVRADLLDITDGTPVGFADHVRAVAEAFGTPRPMSVPMWVLRATPLAHSIMGTDLRLGNTRAKAELGWEPSWAGSRRGVRGLAEAEGRLAA